MQDAQPDVDDRWEHGARVVSAGRDISLLRCNPSFEVCFAPYS